VVVGKRQRPRKVSPRMSVFVSMAELDIAISRARRKLRPNTVYGDDGEEKTNAVPRRNHDNGD